MSLINFKNCKKKYFIKDLNHLILKHINKNDFKYLKKLNQPAI